MEHIEGEEFGILTANHAKYTNPGSFREKGLRDGRERTQRARRMQSEAVFSVLQSVRITHIREDLFAQRARRAQRNTRKQYQQLIYLCVLCGSARNNSFWEGFGCGYAALCSFVDESVFLFSRIKRGYEFCQRGVLKNSGRSNCSTGGNGVTIRTSWSANQQVGLREMLEKYSWSHSPFLRMSTGAKHLHGDRPAYLSACKRLTRFRPSAQR